MQPVRAMLLEQLSISWSLLDYHLRDLEDEECHWRPAEHGLQVRPATDGWTSDWPETEAYDLGPPTIAWVTWHIGFWWSMVLNHSFGDATLGRDDVRWPGSAAQTRVWLRALHDEWVDALSALAEDDLSSDSRTRWPFSGKPFADVGLWLNLELMKNAAEIGYGRFLYAARTVTG